jgi:hypothetical protein
MTEFSFTKIGDGWGIRAWCPPTNIDLVGTTVTVTTKAGAEKKVKLGPVSSVNGKATVFELAAEPKQKDDDKPSLPGPDVVPAGRYAYEGDEGWMFVKVWRKKDRVAVYLIKALEGSLDSGKRIYAKDALEAIAAMGAGKSAQEFGWRTGYCGRCGDELKVNLSRKLGMGPVCTKKVFGDRDRLRLMREARKELRAAGLEPDAKYDSLELAS